MDESRAVAVDGGSEREARLRDSRRQRRRNPTLDTVRVGGGAHQEGGREKISSLSLSLSSPLVSSFDHFPAAAAVVVVATASCCSNAQTTRTTPSGGRARVQAGGPTSVHLDFHLPLSRPPPKPPGFPAKTHTLHSSLLLYLQTRNGEIGQRERDRERERGRSLSVR